MRSNSNAMMRAGASIVKKEEDDQWFKIIRHNVEEF